ncbi:hypothetical protein C8Q73DRAFT_691808 [Cubamyces lactineus]|nr:hypothetical protein C8Q73DRAFT_691808 [Cubamyces lactineus]
MSYLFSSIPRLRLYNSWWTPALESKPVPPHTESQFLLHPGRHAAHAIMVAIGTYAFPVLLLHVLAAVVTSSAAVTDAGPARDQVALGQQDLKYRKVDAQTYELLIDADEERRIVESLKRGDTPNKRGHDVYCSGCGHLIGFQDATGEEGSAPYLDLATPYDRATRIFTNSLYKREPELRHSRRNIMSSVDRHEEVPDGRNHGHVGDKRDEPTPSKWGPVWICKKDRLESNANGNSPSADEDVEISPIEANTDVCQRGGEAMPAKRGLTGDAKEETDYSASPGQDETAWATRIYLIKRHVDGGENDPDTDTIDGQSASAEPVATHTYV